MGRAPGFIGSPTSRSVVAAYASEGATDAADPDPVDQRGPPTTGSGVSALPETSGSVRKHSPRHRFGRSRRDDLLPRSDQFGRRLSGDNRESW